MRGKTKEEKAIFMSKEKPPTSPAIKQRTNDEKQITTRMSTIRAARKGKVGKRKKKKRMKWNRTDLEQATMTAAGSQEIC